MCRMRVLVWAAACRRVLRVVKAALRAAGQHTFCISTPHLGICHGRLKGRRCPLVIDNVLELRKEGALERTRW